MAYNIHFLRGTRADYDGVLEKDMNSFYYLTDENQLYMGTIKLSSQKDVEDALQKITKNENDIDKLEKEISALIGSEEGQTIHDIVENAIAESETKMTVSIDESSASEEFSKVYTIKQGDSQIGQINIPKDMVVRSARVEVLTEQDEKQHEAGTYIVLVIADSAEDEIWINVTTLIDIYTAEQDAKEIQLTVDQETNIISAKIVDNSITKTKLAEELLEAINKAEKSIQSITTGQTNGTISVDGTEVSVAGLGTAAYQDESAFDATGSAAAAEKNAKDYVDEALTWDKIIITVTKAMTDNIINEILGDINNAMSTYAKVTLSDAQVNVAITNGDTLVTKVYTDMFQKLLQALKDNADKYTKITGAQGTAITITEGNVNGVEVVNFVKAVLPGVSGQTKLQDLYGQNFTATFHTVDSNAFTYTVAFASAE